MKIQSMVRRSGRTLRAIREAPQGAYFVWFNSSIRYARDLARILGRSDLKFIGAEELPKVSRTTDSDFVFDHSFWEYWSGRHHPGIHAAVDRLADQDRIK